MPRKSDFPIHVDSSCLTDPTDLQLPSKRNDSDQTVIHKEIEDSHSRSEGSQAGSQGSDDDNTEAFIHAAARAVIASMKENGYGQEDSVLSARTEEGYEAGTEGTYRDGTELTYGDATELDYDSDADHSNQDLYDGSASSHHEDDVFSQGARSNRSSLNSCTDGEEHWKRNQDYKIENEHHSEHIEENHSPISRIPSAASNAYSLLPEPLTITPSPNPHTPSKILSRPAFRTPSSVRAMQMSSPTPSIFSGSPRSSKRPTVSRLGTPNAHNQSPTKNKTPTRFKVKKEYPLVLLHVTVLPLQWPCGDALDAVGVEGLPRELQGVKESWKLLKEKLGDTVLERGILLPHPQDSYEILEERLLEALELPVRPRAKILSCGHYLGPDDAGDSSSEDGSENEDDARMMGPRERWCDICGREVKYEEIGIGGKQKRFRVKVYASNGLMRAGAWAAAWREMERVDVEIEPFVPSHLTPLMDSLMAFHAQPLPTQGLNQGLADHQHESDESGPGLQEEEEAMRRREREEERMREIYGDSPPAASEFDEPIRPQRASSRRQQYGDSLPELIWAAIKVVMRDKKQVAICVLSVLVVILALRPTSASVPVARESAISKVAAVRTEIGAGVFSTGQERIGVTSEKVAEMPAQVLDTVNAVMDEAVIPIQFEEPPAASTKQEILTDETEEDSREGNLSSEIEADVVEKDGQIAAENTVGISQTA
jgi:hypothetical protein